MRAEERGREDSRRRDDERGEQRHGAETCDERAAESPALARALRLVQRLGEMPVAADEIDVARERVRVRVFAAITAQRAGDRGRRPARAADLLAPDLASSLEEHPATADDRVRISARRGGRGTAMRRASRRAIYAVAAALALGLIGLLTASQAAGTALPGAPLYGLKRGEEWIALATAWSDTRRGEVLGEIAYQRLAEVRAEATTGNTVEIHALMAELDDTMRALIGLTAQMDAHHEDSGTVTAALSRALADERSTLVAAQRQGQTVLVKSLSSAAAEQQQAISAAKLTLPLAPAGPPAGPMPSATGSPPSTPAPSGPPAGTRGSSQGSHSSSGSSNASGKGPGSSGSGQGQSSQHGNQGGDPSGRPHGW